MLLTRMSLVVAVIMFAVALSALNAHAEPPPEARIRALGEPLRRTVRQLGDQRKLTEEAQRAIAELRAQVEEVRGRPASAPPATAAGIRAGFSMPQKAQTTPENPRRGVRTGPGPEASGDRLPLSVVDRSGWILSHFPTIHSVRMAQF